MWNYLFLTSMKFSELDLPRFLLFIKFSDDRNYTRKVVTAIYVLPVDIAQKMLLKQI